MLWLVSVCRAAGRARLVSWAGSRPRAGDRIACKTRQEIKSKIKVENGVQRALPDKSGQASGPRCLLKCNGTSSGATGLPAGVPPPTTSPPLAQPSVACRPRAAAPQGICSSKCFAHRTCPALRRLLCFAIDVVINCPRHKPRPDMGRGRQTVAITQFRGVSGFRDR